MSKTRKLLELVWKHPILYNAKREDYKNTRRKGRIWEEIGHELRETGEVSKKKWKNIKDSYTKYLKSLSTKKSRKDRNSYRNWHWANQMEIFKPYLSFNKIELNAPSLHNRTDDVKYEDHDQPQATEIDADIPTTEANAHLILKSLTAEECGNIQGDLPSTSKYEVTSSVEERSSLKKRKVMSDLHEDHITSAIDSRVESHYGDYCGVDGTDLIFQGYAKTVKTFSPIRQAKIKFQIAELLLEHEIEHQAEKSATQISSPSYHREALCHNENSSVSFESYENPLSPLAEESQDDKSLVFCNKQE